MESEKTEFEPKCKTCMLYDKKNGQCKVAILANGHEYHMPVFPEDYCHLDQLGIPVNQVRWWVEDPKTGKPAEKGIVKIEYPVGFFGND